MHDAYLTYKCSVIYVCVDYSSQMLTAVHLVHPVTPETGLAAVLTSVKYSAMIHNVAWSQLYSLAMATRFGRHYFCVIVLYLYYIIININIVTLPSLMELCDCSFCL